MVKQVNQPTLNEVWKIFAFDSIQMEANGRSGGLVSMWILDFFSLIHSWCHQHWIATILRYLPNNQIVLIVNMYAPHIEHKKQFIWSQLSSMANQWPGPLCLLGDFNSVCTLEERLRENIDLNSIDSFNNFINHANLIDQVLSNDVFTWEDHKLLICAKVSANWGPKPFRLNNTWFLKPGFLKFCDDLWNEYDVQGWAAYKIAKKLRLLKADMKLWSSSHQDNDDVNLKIVQEIFELVALKKRKKELSVRIESKRRLHSRFNWLRLGDKNTHFFHIVSRIRQQSSYIAGMMIDNIGQMTLMLLRSSQWRFLNLFSRFNRHSRGFDGTKTPGSDGYSLQFFKKGWSFLENDIMDMFNQFHAHPSFPKGFNSSFIVLIPKSNCARVIEQMRPISLINAPYKILAKTIANRLKLVIPLIISENQNGFVPSRLILDGVMVVNELSIWQS
ncbi:uncharacterized protein [Rutidosis leptorrhynchoides]|uniref:uncharacterized protein n=1 Tax=Rutidosis leptorrhynchoides TaxID=125765 RepID=UPI003A99A6C5